MIEHPTELINIKALDEEKKIMFFLLLFDAANRQILLFNFLLNHYRDLNGPSIALMTSSGCVAVSAILRSSGMSYAVVKSLKQISSMHIPSNTDLNLYKKKTFFRLLKGKKSLLIQ